MKCTLFANVHFVGFYVRRRCSKVPGVFIVLNILVVVVVFHFFYF